MPRSQKGRTNRETEILRHVNRIPPFLCIALAERNLRKMPRARMAELCDVSLSYIDRLAKAVTWERVPIGIISKLTAACSVDIMNQARILDYLDKTRRTTTPFKHLPRRRYDEVCEIGDRWIREVVNADAQEDSESPQSES